MEVGLSTLSKKGQITIPKDARKRLGVSVGDRVLFKIEGEQVVLVRIKERRLSEILDAQEPWSTTVNPFSATYSPRYFE